MFFLDSENIGMGGMLPPSKITISTQWVWGGNKKFK